MNMQEMARQLAENDRKISQLMALQKMASSQDTNSVSFADIQSRADEALSRHGRRAGAPMLGETPLNYRKRLATQLAAFAPKWAALPMGGVNDAAFERIEGGVYADAAAAPIHVPPGELVCVPRKAYGGFTTINEYHGSPDAWMGPLSGSVRQYATKFLTRDA